MRRRNLFTPAAGASAVLCAGVCVLWVRSRSWVDTVTYRWEDGRTLRGYTLWSADGIVALQLFHQRPQDWDWRPGWSAGSLRQPDRPKSRFRLIESGHPLGFAVLNYSTRVYNMLICAPCWFLVLLTAAPPATWCMLVRTRRRRRQISCCCSCGYDLCATPERCPECGVVPRVPPLQGSLLPDLPPR